MSTGSRFNSRITQLAVGRHLPYRTVRVRLTLLYGALFTLSGAALMAIAYALLVNAGFVFSLENSQPVSTPPTLAVRGSSLGLPGSGAKTHPSAQTMAYWTTVARCMRGHGVPNFPDPKTSFPPIRAHVAMISDRDGAILAIPAAINMQSPVYTRAAGACGVMFDSAQQKAQDDDRRTQVRQQLLIQSGIALAGMSLLSLGLGWLMAGRVLQPLEDSYRAQRQFVANASHELRAPLTRLRALSEVALAGTDADFASLRNAHERVLASEQQLEQLIDGLLALTRGQAGLERRERLDLATLTSQAILAQESQLSEVDLSETLHPAPIAGDPRLVERLITNLIDNAIRHNAPRGQVQITTGTRHQHAFLRVANSGPAIAPEDVPRLLQPFQRLAGRTQHNNGHGLGLSIVQAIANAHRAELTVLTRAEGGLNIEVSFPPAAVPGSPATFAGSWITRVSPRTGLVRLLRFGRG